MQHAYPPPPWQLEGWGIATVGLIDRDAAAAYVPAGASLLSIVPGKTVGGLFFFAYERGSLRYHELNLAVGVVRVGRRIAFVLARLYVDSPASLAGGREVWAVPKELAAFTVHRTDRETVVETVAGNERICQIRCTASSPSVRCPLPLPSFGVRDDAFLFFTGALTARLAIARAEVVIAPHSQWAPLGLDRPRAGLRCDDLTLTVPAPRIVPRTAQRRKVAYAATAYGDEQNGVDL